LIGFPLHHSFSQKYFTEKFEKEGRKECVYELFPIPSITELPQLVRDHPDLEGLNVTRPHKKTVMAYLDGKVLPGNLQVCNCIRISGRKLFGYNTDVIGFEKSLQPVLRSHHKKALVLGQGGAAEAVLFVLNKLGIEISVVSRFIHGAARYTYSELDEKKIRENTLIINTTPLGTFPDTETFPVIPYEFISSEHLCYDLVYNPSLTVFLHKAELQGARIKNGEEMLIIQAEESWKIWNA